MSATVGVLGGMGPAATVDFLDRLIRATPVAADQDHLRVVIDCNPGVPDRNRALRGEGDSPGPVLAGMGRNLESIGAEFLVIACNTAHAFLQDVRQAVAIPVVDMIGEAAAAAKAAAPKARVGLLAADGCLQAKLYQTALAKIGLEAVTPSAQEQLRFMECLYSIKAGAVGPDQTIRMASLAGCLADAGADLVIAACTEVPLVLSQADCALPLLNATDILVQRTIAYATGEAPLANLKGVFP